MERSFDEVFELEGCDDDEALDLEGRDDEEALESKGRDDDEALEPGDDSGDLKGVEDGRDLDDGSLRYRLGFRLLLWPIAIYTDNDSRGSVSVSSS